MTVDLAGKGAGLDMCVSKELHKRNGRLTSPVIPFGSFWDQGSPISKRSGPFRSSLCCHLPEIVRERFHDRAKEAF